MLCSSVVLHFALVCAVGPSPGFQQPLGATAPAGAYYDVLYQVFSSLKIEPKINNLHTSHARAGRALHENDKWMKVLQFTSLDIQPRAANGTPCYTTIINEILDERGKYEGFNYSLFDEKIKNVFDTMAEMKEMYFRNGSRGSTVSEELEVLREADNIQSNAADAEFGETKNNTDESDEWVSVKNVSRAMNASRRIFGGAQTRIRHFPFAASVLARGRLACAGAIIAPDLVISAASCLQLCSLGGRVRRASGGRRRRAAAALAVRAGSSYFDGGGELLPVLEVHEHPAFDADTLRHNLAILRLRRLIIFQKWNNKVKKIHIDKNARGRFFKSDSVTIVGWGANTISNKIRSRKISMAVLNIYSTEDCQDIYSKTYVTKKHFCAGLEASGAGACNSDAGAPGVVRGLLAGVVSFGSPSCGARDSPTVFTKLGYYSDWIGKIIKKKQPKYYGRPTTPLPHTKYTVRNASWFNAVEPMRPARQEDEFQNYLRQLHTVSTTASTAQSRFRVAPMQHIIPNYVESSEEQFLISQQRNTFQNPTWRPYLGQSALWRYPYAFQNLKHTNMGQNRNQFSREQLFRPLYGTEIKKSTQPLYTFQTVMSMNVALDSFNHNAVKLSEDQRIRPLRDNELRRTTRSPYMVNPILSMDLQLDPIQRYAVKPTDKKIVPSYKNLPKKLAQRPLMFLTGMNTNLGRNQDQFGVNQLVRPLFYNTRLEIPTRRPYSYPTIAINIDYKVERLERNADRPKQQFVRQRNGYEFKNHLSLFTTNSNKTEAVKYTTTERYKYFPKIRHFNMDKDSSSETYTNFAPKHTQLKWLPQLDEEKVAADVALSARRPQTVLPMVPYSKQRGLGIGTLKKRVNQPKLPRQDEQAPKTSSDQEIDKLLQLDEDKVTADVALPARRPQTIQPKGPYFKQKVLGIGTLNKRVNQSKLPRKDGEAPKISSDQEIDILLQLDEDKVAADVALPARRPKTIQPKVPYYKQKYFKLTEQDEQAPKTSSDQEIDKKIDQLLGNYEKEVITSSEEESVQNRYPIQNTKSQDLLNLSEGENQREKQEKYSVRYENLNKHKRMSVERFMNSKDISYKNNLKDLFEGIPKNDVYEILAEAVQMAPD